MGIGLGIFVGGLFSDVLGMDDDIAMPGSILFLAGLGLFLGFFFTKKLTRTNWKVGQNQRSIASAIVIIETLMFTTHIYNVLRKTKQKKSSMKEKKKEWSFKSSILPKQI